MGTFVKRFVSAFTLVTVLLVSGISICTQMMSVSCLGCAHHEMSMLETASHQGMNDCGMNNKNCSSPSSDHMTTFARLYPSTPVDALLNILFVLGVVFVVIRSFNIKDYLIDAERLKAKVKNYRRNLANSPAPNFLVFAFSRGILHSKIYT